MGVLYKLSFSSGKAYIGVTTRTIAYRFQQHSKMLQPNTLICRAWKKYGAPITPTLAIVENHILGETEQKAIKIFRTLKPHGYNMTPGGDFSPMLIPEIAARAARNRKGVIYSKQALANFRRGAKKRPKVSKPTRDKMATAGKLRKNNKGNGSIENVWLMNEAWRGKHHKKAARLKIAQSMLGNTRMLGKRHSEKTKKQMSESAKRRAEIPISEKTRRRISKAAKRSQTHRQRSADGKFR